MRNEEEPGRGRGYGRLGDDMGSKAKAGQLRRFLKVLGPGLITGAADDDPSGIVTFSQAGAAFRYGLLWVVPLQVPLMIAVQMMCARIGLVSGWDLAGVLREHYPRWVLWLCFLLLFIANTVSIAADIDGIAAAAELLTGLPSLGFVLPVTALIFAMIAFRSYRFITMVFKWLTLSLPAYVIAGVLAGPKWGHVLRATFIPGISSSKGYLVTFVGLFGTTISPSRPWPAPPPMCSTLRRVGPWGWGSPCEKPRRSTLLSVCPCSSAGRSISRRSARSSCCSVRRCSTACWRRRYLSLSC